jgi:hypothetical protein
MIAILKRWLLAAALGTGLGAAALAEDAPKTADDCLKKVIDLSKSAADKKLGQDKLDKLEDLLTKMEGHCEAKQFADAMTDAKDVRSAIDGK